MFWIKRPVNTLAEYKSSFSGGNSSSEVTDTKTKAERAYETAADIRKFEIDKYWSRTAYFWAFITTIYGAYFAVLINLYKFEKENCKPCFSHGEIPLIVLSALGLFFSFLWYLANEASRHWQENWETHMDLLEDSVTGPLYKTFLADKSYSVSKINIVASKVITFCAYCLLQYEFIEFMRNKLSQIKILAIVFTIIFALLTILALFVIKINVMGNAKDFGELNFVQRIYGDEDERRTF